MNATDVLPQGVIGFTASGTVTYANPRAGEIFGRPVAALVGASFLGLGLVRVADRKRLRRFRQWVASRVETTRAQFLRIEPNHGVVAVRIVQPEGLGETRYLMSLWPPTRTASVDEELATILDYAGDPVVTVDDDGNIGYFNRAAERVFGLNREDVVGHPFSILLAGRNAVQQAADIWTDTPEPEERAIPSPFLLKCLTVDGLQFTAECAVSHTERNDKNFHTVILRDVSKQLSELAEARREIDLHRVVMENMAEGMVVFDRDRRVLAFNHRYLELLNFPEGSVHVGQSLTDIMRYASRLGVYGPGSEAEHLETRQQKWQHMAESREELRIPDGRVLSLRRKRLPGGGFVVTLRDVTERRARETALQEAKARLEAGEKRLRAIVDNSGDAILLLDSSGCVLSANPATRTCFGREPGKLGGARVETLLPAFPFFQKDGGLGTKIPDFHRAEMMGIREDGEKFPVEVMLSRVDLAESSFYVLDVRDMSQQRTMQEQLVQASKLSLLGEMAAGMAHELNQPLSVMRMAADNALMRIKRNKAEPEYLSEALELISNQAGKMGNTILNLRIFARREDNDELHSFSPINAVQAACQLLRGKLHLDSIEVDIDAPETGRKVDGAGTQFEQVIINLLSNARDAIVEKRRHAPDGATDRIVVRVEDQVPDRAHLEADDAAAPRESIRVTVDDTGGGIPPDIMAKIFNPFFTTKEVGKGTGLGLSISYGIISSMRGEIAARNIPGGTRFEIVLPVCESDTETTETDDAGQKFVAAKGVKS